MLILFLLSSVPRIIFAFHSVSFPPSPRFYTAPNCLLHSAAFLTEGLELSECGHKLLLLIFSEAF